MLGVGGGLLGGMLIGDMIQDVGRIVIYLIELEKPADILRGSRTHIRMDTWTAVVVMITEAIWVEVTFRW